MAFDALMQVNCDILRCYLAKALNTCIVSLRNGIRNSIQRLVMMVNFPV